MYKKQSHESPGKYSVLCPLDGSLLSWNHLNINKSQGSYLIYPRILYELGNKI